MPRPLFARVAVVLGWVLAAAVGCAGGEDVVAEGQPGADVAMSSVASPAAAVVAVHRVAPTREPIAPWSLTASDGTGLELRAIDAKAILEGPLAFTELHLRFHNPEHRVREGTFAITLPTGAAVSRFAMIEDGHPREAEVVPTALARRAYDDEIHRGIDPAILEKGAGNQFTARVFPIPADGDKELVVSFSQELAGAGYLLPLTGFPSIDDVSVSLDAVGADGAHQRQALHEVHWQPDHDFFADVESTSGVASEGLVAAAYELQPAGSAAEDRPADLTVLVDTSASRAPGFGRYGDRVRDLISGLAARDPGLVVDVIAFDQATQSIYRGPATGFGAPEVAALVKRRADGASDLGRAFAAVHRGARVAVITDGVVTAGLEGAALTAAVRKAAPARVDVVLAGGIRDDRMAHTLVRAGDRPGDVFDLDTELEPVEQGLGEAVQVDVPVAVAGATWSYPRVVASVRPGTQVTVYARLPSATDTMTAAFGGVLRTAKVRQGTPALVERAAARAQIEDLEVQLAAATTEPAKTTLRKQIEATSVGARVVSSQATMLVLDNDSEYARYGIDRTALADILVVGPDGLEQQHRTFVASKPREAGRRPLSRQAAIDAARSVGTLGSLGAMTGGGRFSTVGQGAGTGQGYGYGAAHGMMHGRTASVPTVVIGQAVSNGDLDKSLIRRYLQRSFEKLRYCYERELLARPTLDGTVVLHFVIDPSGHVVDVSASGLDETVSTCLAHVVEAIEFPAARGGGAVLVSYPLTFHPAEAAAVRVVGAGPARAPTPTPSPTAGAAASPAPAAATSPTAAPAPAPVRAPAASPDPSPALAVAPGPAPLAVVPAPPAPPEHATRVGAIVAMTEEVRNPAPPAPTDADASHDAPATAIPHFDPEASALRGRLAQISRAISRHDPRGALSLATAWRDEQPTDVLAIIGLGEAYEATGDRAAAARAYGSLIDLYPSRADYRRFAGERLERLGDAGRHLAIDTYRRAVTDRPDQITGHRLLAYALLRAHDDAGAFAAILAGIDQPHIDGRFLGADRVFARDAGMIATVYAAHGGDRARITAALDKRHLDFVTEASTRVLLYWETDANDVDLHVRDAHGGHSWYSHKPLESGGELYADITTGFGPECFEIVGTPTAGPYDIGVHYYRQGPMGYGMGLAQVVRFDGASFAFDDRPYVIMQDEAYVSLGAFP